MMQEKDIVNDVLSQTKASMGNYAKVISECSDQNLRKTFQQMRDGDEQFQYNLYKIAEKKGYYTPAPQVSQNESSQLKSHLSSGLGGQGMGSGTMNSGSGGNQMGSVMS